MNDKTTSPEGGDDTEPRFDVKARCPAGMPLEELEHRLIEVSHLPPEKAAALVNALRSGPVVVLGRGVTRSRADRALELEKSGLEVEVAPVLTLAPKLVTSPDGSTECPACGERSVLGVERQCPHCGVYVDKVTPEFLLRRKIQEQERARLAWQMQHKQQKDKHEDAAALEARLREEIRAELEARHGLRRRQGWRAALGSWQALGAVGSATAVAFAAGWWLPRWLPLPQEAPMSSAAASGRPVAGGAPQDVDALLARLDEFAPAAGVAQAAGTSALAAADSLRSASSSAGGRVLAGGHGPLLGALSTMSANGTEAAGGPPALALDPATVPRDLQPQLISQLAQALAESGQSARALEARDALDGWRNASEGEVAALLRRTRLLVDAWALQDRHPAAVQARLQSLRTDAAALTDPGERAAALAAVAVVLAHHGSVPETLLQGLMTQAGEAIKTVTDSALRTRLMDQWLVAEGQQQLERARQEASAGHFSRARARTMALANLSGQSKDASTQVQLMALQTQAERLMGQTAGQGTGPWQAAWAKMSDPLEQARTLRAVAALQPGVLDEGLRQAATQLAARTDALPAPQRARTLAQLALLWADSGAAEAYQALRDRALKVPGVSGEAAVRLRAELLAGGDIALASALQRSGQLALADQRWRSVASYLL